MGEFDNLRVRADLLGLDETPVRQGHVAGSPHGRATPAWMRHGVRPHRGSGDRISIAMNIDVKA